MNKSLLLPSSLLHKPLHQNNSITYCEIVPINDLILINSHLPLSLSPSLYLLFLRSLTLFSFSPMPLSFVSFPPSFSDGNKMANQTSRGR